MDTLSQITSSPYFSMVGFLVGLIGLGTSIYFFIQSRTLKQIAWKTEDSKLIEENITKIENVQVSYQGKPVNRLKSSRITFWNSGSTVIDTDDIAAADPLGVKTDAEILSGKVIQTTNGANQVQVTIKNRSAEIIFDFLNPLDGAIIELMLEGNAIDFSGQIKGGSIYSANQDEEERHKITDGTSVGCWLVGMGCWVLVGGVTLFDPRTYQNLDPIKLPMLCIAALSVVAYPFLAFRLLKPRPRKPSRL